MEQINRKTVLIVICMLAAGICYSCGGKNGREEAFLETAALESSVFSETETAAPACCYVHICGEVNSPGVYEVAEGSRIFEVVELAGGYTDAAASDYLNMAEIVTDGMKLIVPVKGEEAVLPSFGESYDKKVNLNTATKEELMTLKGIGEARAADIISYREKHGEFRNVEEIMKIPGIKDAAFQKIKDDIVV
ncbi:hypothetical protein GPL15_21135 [Clostridium sp. MCC353]|uniref:helix-hairpin-helix domain-containing protein n=1 Tax=Clostridium sp. MCC353 TaxID=2592646 RepID=UPI001C03599F|nr:helix-hairpin-helix domain-containing protein [Clostridium sp. MCC353]MBT9778985.1 hypothetical protein [Clostridium sp. MCC353]